MRRRRTAVATALLCAALAAAGCGLGPGEELGEAGLTITRDYGSRQLHEPLRDRVGESDTVMRLLERNADIETRYGGGFVQSIDGLEGMQRAGRAWDWFFFVNGVESSVGAAEYRLRAGDEVWWDHREWTSAMRVPAVVGSWPQPFSGGFDGRERRTEVVCRTAEPTCAEVRRRLEEAGADLGAGRDAIRVLVGPWPRLGDDPAARALADGPQASGVFARFAAGGRPRLAALDEGAAVRRRLGAGAGLVAATRRFEDPPTWLVTGVDDAGAAAAARLLAAGPLRNRFAVATAGGRAIPLPLRR